MIRVTIAGTEVETSGIVIYDEITHSPNTCSFYLHAPDSAPTAGQEVICYLDTVGNTKLFAGIIVSVAQIKLAPHETPALRAYTYSVECQDYSRLLNQRLVIETYVSQNSKQIIDDIVVNFTDAAHGFTTTNVDTSRTITRIVYNYIPVFQAISELADLLEWDWYIDEDKDIHFFERETLPAPLDIDDTAVTTYINNFALTPDYTQVRNRVYVRGGTEEAGPITQSIVADGEARYWTMAYSMSDLSFTLDGVPKTVAVDNLNADDGTYQYFWNSSEKYVRCGDGGPEPTPTTGQVLAVTYDYKVPVIIRADNVVSQAAIAAIEGGDGIYESIIRDETIDSKALARDRATAEVNQFGNVQITGGFDTYEAGFRTGQFVSVSVSGYSALAGNYQIQRVVIRADGPNDELYTVTFASTLYELKDFLISLVKAQSRIKLREDEVVDVLLMIEENITVTETGILVTLNTHPAKWGTFKWGMGTWGGVSGWFRDWSRRIKIDVDYTTGIGASVTHFPVIIFLKAGNGDTDKVFDLIGANKQKIAITDSGGERQLFCEIEYWDEVGKEGIIHVSRSDWIISADTSIYLYYDNTKPDNTDYVGITPNDDPSMRVWDDNFVMIQHMNDSPDISHITDSTSNSNDGTKKGVNEPIEAVGEIGKAQQFDGSDDYIGAGNDASLKPTVALTVSVIIKSTASGAVQWVIHRGSDANSGFYIMKQADKYLNIRIFGTTGNSGVFYLTTDNTIYHITITYESGVGGDVFINGADEGTFLDKGDIVYPSDTNLNIGMLIIGAAKYYPFTGIIDEARISNTARTAAWIKAEVNSGNDSLLTYGSQAAF